MSADHLEKVKTLETARLRLRPFEVSDEQHLSTLMGDAEVMRLYGSGVALTPGEARSCLKFHRECRQHDYWAWALEHKEDGRFIGVLSAGISEFESEKYFEPAWIIARQEWGQGFATEAAKCVIEYAVKTLKQTLVYAVTHPENRGSARVVEKIGLKFLRETVLPNGRPRKIFIARF